MPIDLNGVIVEPPPGSLVASLPARDSTYAYPKLTILAELPSRIQQTLEPLWRQATRQARDVNIYRLKSVHVAGHGLVFNDDRRLIDVTRTYHSNDEINAALVALNRSSQNETGRFIDRAILAKSRGADNYGHFLIEMLPRAWVARQELVLNDWPVLIYASGSAVERVSSQALQSIGFASETVIAVDDEPIKVGELIVVDGLTDHTVYMSSIVLDCLDDIAAGVPRNSDSSIYVPRRPTPHRDFEEERQIASGLGKIGFKETPTGQMTFVEQVAAFKGAEVVVGVSGAALANTIFCRPATKVFSFTPASASEVLFWMIGEARQLDYREIRCEEVGPCTGALPWDRTLKIAPEEVLRLVTAT